MGEEFQIDYFYRWNERIFVPSQTVGDTAATGAISEIVTNNLAPNKLLVSDSGGKIVTSLVTAPEAAALTGIDTGQTIQEQLDAKQDAITTGNLTEATSSVLTITGGTGAVIGSGLSIQVKLAATAQSGYLSSTDWNTFNNKLTSTLSSGRIFVGNGSNLATGVTAAGVITINSAGVFSFVAGAVLDADVSGFAQINRAKLADGTPYRIVANNVFGIMSENAALTASRITLSNANGQLVSSAATTTHALYISTLTDYAQEQMDTKITGKATNALVQAPTAAQDGFAITWDDGAQQWNLTDPVVQGIPVAGSTSQVLMKNSGTNYDSSWTSLLLSHISDISALAADLNILAGASAAGVTDAEFQFINGVTANIQTQINTLAATINNGWLIGGNTVGANSTIGTNDIFSFGIKTNNSERLGISSTGVFTFSQGSQSSTNTFITATQASHTGGSPVGLLFTGGAHTTLALAEAIDINFNLARTVEFVNAVGPTTQRAVLFQAPTYAHVAGTTRAITTAATVAISASPIAGTATTITNSLALWVQSGRVVFDSSNGSTTVGGVTISDTVSSLKILLDLRGASGSSFAVTQEGRMTVGTSSSITLGVSDAEGYFKLTANVEANGSGGSSSASQQFITGTVTANQNANVMYGYRMTSTFAAGAFTPSIIGYDYNPTITGSPSSHLAARYTSGQFLVGGSTITAGSVLVDLQSATQSLLITRVTNIASVATPVDGMFCYDAATNLFNFRQNGSWVTLGGEIQTLTVSVSSAELLNINSAPKELIPAPGAGKIIDVISAEVYLDYGTVAYTGGNAMYLAYDSSQFLNQSVFSINGASDNFQKINLDNQTAFISAIRVNNPVYLYNQSGNPATGDGTVKVFLTYRIITI